MKSIIAITLLAVVGVALAAPSKYGGHHGGHVVPSHPVEHTYQAVAPAVKCGHNLLVSCGAHHAVVPCKAAEHGHGGYHAAPAPAHQSYHHAPAAAPHYAPAPYHAPAHHAAPAY